MAILKLEEWQGGSGKWYCADTSNLAKDSAYWYHEALVWGKSGDNFVQMLVDNFHCDNITYNKEKDVLVYYWNNQKDMRKYKNATNAQARKVGYQI